MIFTNCWLGSSTNSLLPPQDSSPYQQLIIRQVVQIGE
jgi:hypothetical protein